MQDLSDMLKHIETTLDQGTYQPDAWAQFLQVADRHPPAARRAIAEDVSRVSEKLHLRHGRRILSFRTAILLEWVTAGIGLVLLGLGRKRSSNVIAGSAATLLAFTFQPLIKTSVGNLLGIRYTYGYLQGGEPRFKMRYGTYLLAPPWKRIVLHLSGAVGTPLALIFVSRLTRERLPTTSLICAVFFAFTLTMQIVFFFAGVTGLKSPRWLHETTRRSSPGTAGAELRKIVVETEGFLSKD